MNMFHIIFTVQFLTNHKFHTYKMHYIFTLYFFTPTYISALIRPSSGGSYSTSIEYNYDADT
jgi:hypothetical protein